MVKCTSTLVNQTSGSVGQKDGSLMLTAAMVWTGAGHPAPAEPSAGASGSDISRVQD